MTHMKQPIDLNVLAELWMQCELMEALKHFNIKH